MNHQIENIPLQNNEIMPKSSDLEAASNFSSNHSKEIASVFAAFFNKSKSSISV